MNEPCRLDATLDEINSQLQAFFNEVAPELLSDHGCETVSDEIACGGYRINMSLGWVAGNRSIVVVVLVLDQAGAELCTDHGMILYGISGIRQVQAVATAGGVRYECDVPSDCCHDDLFPSVQTCPAKAA